MNWDILIFPEVGDSKTPLQEFGTNCTVTQDPGICPPIHHNVLQLLQNSIETYDYRHCSDAHAVPPKLHRRHSPIAHCVWLHSQPSQWDAFQGVFA